MESYLIAETVYSLSLGVLHKERKKIIILCIELKYNWCEIGTNPFT